jgi:hypothetical protein
MDELKLRKMFNDMESRIIAEIKEVKAEAKDSESRLTGQIDVLAMKVNEILDELKYSKYRIDSLENKVLGIGQRNI